MLLKDLIKDNEIIFVYEFDKCLTSTDMQGELLFKGKPDLLPEDTLNKKVIRMFERVHTVFIVE